MDGDDDDDDISDGNGSSDGGNGDEDNIVLSFIQTFPFRLFPFPRKNEDFTLKKKRMIICLINKL